MSKTTTLPDEYNYHENIHRDEERYREDLAEIEFYNPGSRSGNIQITRMELSGRINPIDNFAISSVDNSNFAYFNALFLKMEEEAKVSKHE